MKTLFTVCVFLLLCFTSDAQLLKRNAIGYSSETEKGKEVILKKSNVSRLTVKNSNQAANQKMLIREIFPNPFSENINLEFYSKEEMTLTIKITDIIGKKIHQTIIAKPEGSMHVNVKIPPVSPGIYLLNVQKRGVKAISYNEKIIKTIN